MYSSGCNIKWYPRLGIYKNSTGSLVYNPNTKLATSYGHWYLLRDIDGTLVLNSHGYSVTTSNHVGELMHQLRKTNVKFVEVDTRHNIKYDGSLGLHYIDLQNKQVSYKVKSEHTLTNKKAKEKYKDSLAFITDRIEDFVKAFGHLNEVKTSKINFDKQYVEYDIQYTKEREAALERARNKRAELYYHVDCRPEGRYRGPRVTYSIPKKLFNKLNKADMLTKLGHIDIVESKENKLDLHLDYSDFPEYTYVRAAKEIDNALT